MSHFRQSIVFRQKSDNGLALAVGSPKSRCQPVNAALDFKAVIGQKTAQPACGFFLIKAQFRISVDFAP